MDASLNESYSSEEVERCIQIELLFVQDHAVERPTIEDVVSFLSNDTIQLGQPILVAFLTQFGHGQTPQLILERHYDPYGGNCSILGRDIRKCQKKGIKVMLSIGGTNRESGYSKRVLENSLCLQQRETECARQKKDFVERFGYMATNGFIVSENTGIEKQCCEGMCKNNCSCEAYASLNFVNDTGCQL
ncbi:hypothetical protein VNO78_12223 [Psophocarpus tetragonolobus]|uniref:Apple domain-containing protein n=1 Tax=Psophocarpus tetragonolobus TaxID=3891 RepID=A0AAN9XP89_PSOTE